jgi:hypothetical protein
MKRSPRSRLLAGAVAAVAVTTFVAACGDDDDAATTSVAATTGRTAASTETSTASDDTATDETASDETVDTTDGSDASTPGGGSASGEEADYVAAIQENIQLADEDMSKCLASAVVDAIGFDRIQASGLSPEALADSGGDLGEGEQALTPDQSEDLKAAFLDCGNVLDALVAADDISDDQKDCVRDAIDNEQAAEIIANQWTGADDSEEIAAAKEQASTCVDRAEDDASTTTTTG